MSVVERIKWYPIILVACYTVPLIHRFVSLPPPPLILPNRGMEISSHEFNHHRFIGTLSYVTLKLQGFFDALAYSATPQVLKKWQTLLYDSLVPTFEWSSSYQTSSLIGGMIMSSDSSKPSATTTGSPPPSVRKRNEPISSNSNSKGSSYFSYAQEESGLF
jgi:hypothetical protein